MVRRDVIETIRDLSVQSRATQVQPYGITNAFSFLVKVSGLIPPWWSKERDSALSKFWKTGDHLSGAVYAMQSKMVTIPFHIEPLDMSNKSHMAQADRMTYYLLDGAEFGEGWSSFFTPVIEDLLTQDNGRFMEVIGRGSKVGPIEGMPLTVTHLDAQRCQRTGDFEFPILYEDDKGTLKKLHYTRVMYDSQMPSSRIEMNGVGFSAVSRAIHNAQHLIDISTHEEEKLGSRPFRGMLLAGGGLDPEAVGNALLQAQTKLDAAGFTRYSRIPVVGSPEIETPTLNFVTLSNAPEYFKKEESTSLAMAAIALAFGVDARELWPMQSTGATRADAMLSHIKTQGKGPGHILETTERLFNSKFLPGHLRLVFDYQDDTQDRQKAEIRQVRSRARDRDIVNKITNPRVERQKMFENGEIDLAQFKEMELSDGRLPDGTSVLTLFYSEDQVISEMLALGVENPTVISSNSAESMISKIEKQTASIYEIISNVDNNSVESAAMQSIAALDELMRQYKEQKMIDDAEEAMRRQERDQFGDGAGVGGKDSISSETSLSSNDTSMNPDDKKAKGIRGFFESLKREKQEDIIEEVPEAVEEKEENPLLVNIRNKNIDLSIAPPRDKIVTKRPKTTESRKDKVEIIDVERNEHGEITTIRRRYE